MWVEMARIIREVGPRFVFVENSPMLTSRGLGRVLGDLATMGYDARWGVLGAKSTGGFHERERIWIYAFYSDCDRREAPKYKQSVLETKNGYKGHARHLAGAVGVDGIRGMVDAYVQRDSNVVAFAVDRFRAIGNGQVPSVAALAWRILSESTP
jgi:DNA (cytosine-5)-methyltransferase 1